ncbi:MAG: DUF3857 domain-containing protein, partial [Calditrichaeota bacterium]
MITNRSIYFKLFISVMFSGLILSFLSCAGKNRWATEVKWADIDIDQLPGSREFPEEGAFVVLDDGRMEIFGSGTISFSEFKRHKIIKILDYHGERFANVKIPYSSGVTVNDIRARTISPSGKITVLRQENIYDVNLYPNFVFYSDQRAKIFTLPAIEPGSIIEYCYNMSIKGRTLWHSWIFQEEIPTLQSRFTLIHPAEWDPIYRLYNLEVETEVIEAPDGFKETRTWNASDLPPVVNEFGMPPAKDIISRLSFAPIGVKTWDDVAGWYYELASDRMSVTEEIRSLAENLTEDQENNRDKLKKIYEWVRDNVRYIAVEIGIGGFQPYPATQVLTNQYGDCKDMSTLLCAMAGAVDIPCYQVLISTRNNGNPDTSLPSPFHFNHAIAYSPLAEDSGIWLDATEKGCPFGKLPWYDQGVPVLVVKERGEGQLIMTPIDSSGVNISKEIWDIKLIEDGSADIRGRMVLKGAAASEMRENFYYSSRLEMKQWLERYLAERYPGASLDTFSLRGMVPVEDPLQLNFVFSAPSAVLERNKSLIFRPSDIMIFRLPHFFRSRNRIHPIKFRFPFRNEQEFRIKTPAHYNLTIIAQSDSMVSEYGVSWISVSSREDTIMYRTGFQLDETDISPEKYGEFQEFLSSV